MTGWVSDHAYTRTCETSPDLIGERSVNPVRKVRRRIRAEYCGRRR
jgi:hypothetical protein